ncbi:hypothetical protein [Spongiactinospora gelatinilytica]|uniref:hypothetical protein n=1 Tax=Spongiactinospora gelatinilytica TaxID=2666298 RepID=UPI001313D841|nr:hypothetical protein [Spongiactinospora gelatinilytica]
MGATALAGAEPASASAPASITQQTSTTSALAPLPPNWYYSSRYETLAACHAGLQDAAQNGEFTGLAPCRYYPGDQHRQAGWYFLMYIP